MGNKINVLDFKVANLIAAGEVVERPASAIKELIENSVDAGAKNITVEIQNGGISLMRVTDDGCGMSREDTEMCIRRHATSKIKDASDLAYIITLGFRGEALAAIASVSRLRIFSKRREDQVGTLLSSDGGRNVTVTETGCASGTTVIAEELFANVPARRKFLKKDAAETMAVTGIVEKAALAHPEIAISLICDGKLRYRTSGDGDLRSAIYAVMGRECANNLIPVRALSDGIEINGFVGTPELIRKNRHGESFFLNGRYVRNTTAQSALEAAFRTYIPSDKFPMSVLHLKIHPSLVDVNVHPAKLEVKFAEERKVFEAIYAAVRGALTHSIPRPEYGERTPDDKRQEGEAALSSFVPLPDRTERKKPEDRSLFIEASGLRTRSAHDCFGTGASGVGSMSGGTGSASLGTVGAGNIDRRLLDIEYDGALPQEKTAGGATEKMALPSVSEAELPKMTMCPETTPRPMLAPICQAVRTVLLSDETVPSTALPRRPICSRHAGRQAFTQCRRHAVRIAEHSGTAPRAEITATYRIKEMARAVLAALMRATIISCVTRRRGCIREELPGYIPVHRRSAPSPETIHRMCLYIIA